MGGVLVLVVTFALMWALFILPQQRRVKRHQALVATLAVGDEVMTTSGMRGTITNLDDELVHLEIAERVVVRFARGAVSHRLDEEIPAGPIDTGSIEAGSMEAELPPGPLDDEVSPDDDLTKENRRDDGPESR